jgi:hypothetical protein
LDEVQQSTNPNDLFAFLTSCAETETPTTGITADGDNKPQSTFNTPQVLHCDNPHCQVKHIETVHRFEIDGEHEILICANCYDLGYRFCLFTHEVLHMDQMDSVLENMYAQKSYHKGQLSYQILCCVPNLYQYFKMIGIENPDPTHSIVNLHEIDQPS